MQELSVKDKSFKDLVESDPHESGITEGRNMKSTAPIVATRARIVEKDEEHHTTRLTLQ
jgi:hypothetical protein